MEKKINLHVIKQNIVTNGENDMTTKILVTVLSMVSEMERELISQRTKNGLELVKKRGKKLGNPNIRTHVERIKEESEKWAERYRSLITGFVNSGLTQRQIVEELNKLKIQTRRGSEWRSVTLQRVIKRLGLKTRR